MTVFVGATPGKTVSAGFAALYEGKTTGKLLAQSKTENFNEGIEAGKPFTFTLESTVRVTPENAPKGFLYCVIALTSAEAMATMISSPGGPLDLGAVLR